MCLKQRFIFSSKKRARVCERDAKRRRKLNGFRTMIAKGWILITSLRPRIRRSVHACSLTSTQCLLSLQKHLWRRHTSAHKTNVLKIIIIKMQPKNINIRLRAQNASFVDFMCCRLAKQLNRKRQAQENVYSCRVVCVCVRSECSARWIKMHNKFEMHSFPSLSLPSSRSHDVANAHR